MGERKYSLDEIDLMRRALSFILSADAVGSYMPSDITEGRLRTYRANGIEPQELVDKALATESRLGWKFDPKEGPS